MTVGGKLSLTVLAVTTVGAEGVVAAIEPVLREHGARRASHVLLDVLLAVAEATGGTQDDVLQAFDRVTAARRQRGHGFGPKPGAIPS